VDVETAAHLAGATKHALLAHVQAFRDRPAPQVVDARTQLHPMQAFALEAPVDERLRRACGEPPPDERLVEPEPELTAVVGACDDETASAGKLIADPDAVRVQRALVAATRVHPRSL